MSDSLPNMYGPKEQIDALAKGLGVPIPSNVKNRYVFPCKKNMPDITLTVGVLGGTTANVILKPDQYIEKTFNDTGEVCLFSMFELKEVSLKFGGENVEYLCFQGSGTGSWKLSSSIDNGLEDDNGFREWIRESMDLLGLLGSKRI
ncbi:unnamed protein product [Meloidogyne enterolobii]|uniref:Uncharacterized protein n=1 Tax=Meloidogyne enterolobii TaxID=390850 RepID=A0ACB1AK75_MELEN